MNIIKHHYFFLFSKSAKSFKEDKSIVIKKGTTTTFILSGSPLYCHYIKWGYQSPYFLESRAITFDNGKKRLCNLIDFCNEKFCRASYFRARLTKVNATQKTMNVFIHLPETLRLKCRMKISYLINIHTVHVKVMQKKYKNVTTRCARYYSSAPSRCTLVFYQGFRK